MKSPLIAIALVLSLMIPHSCVADSVSSAERAKIQKTVDKISKVAGKDLKVDAISTTPVSGLYQVTSDFSIFYVSTDGKYVFSGEMIDVSKDPKNWSLTEQEMRTVRKNALAAIALKDMIVYPATAKKIGVVYVFTDIDCHYCQKLQENIKEYTDKGIEIRYLAFPRQGVKSKSFGKTVSVWCAEDRNKAYAAATAGKDVADNQCKNNPVQAEFELGVKLAVRGTPTMMLEDGQKIGGLISSEELAKAIKAE